jgi:hypothetical protein
MRKLCRLNWLVALMFVGCEEAPPEIMAGDASAERNVDEGIVTASVTCRRGMARPRVLSEGEVDHAIFNVWEVLPEHMGFDEEHDLRTYAAATDGAWSRSGTRLAVDVDLVDFEPGRSTLFGCDGDHSMVHSPDFTFAARTYDSRGGLLDCVMWGGHIDEVLHWGEDVTTYNSVSNPEELNAACRRL